MMRIESKVLCLVLLALALAVNVDAGEGDTLITDPALLTRLGFSPNARNVYLAKGAVLDQKSSPAEPEEYGTADFGWTTVLGNQHRPLTSNATYSTSVQDGSIYRTGGGFTFDAQLHLPSGTLLQQVAWFGLDNDAGIGASINGSVVRVCQTGFPTVGPPVVTILGSADSPDTGDFIFAVVVPAGEVVSNLTCAYTARTIFSPFADQQLVLRKVRAGWQRQVSPAPATATFPNDTPTTHPYFRFIEALAAAGITGGCGPQSYCPNNPITRGEMAVFLAVALGLHSPN